MGFKVGRSLTAFTVRINESLTDAWPSLTVMVMVVLPNWLEAGVMVTNRLLSLPLNTMFPLGTRLVLEEMAESVSRLAGVSWSPMVKGIAAVGVSSFVFVSAMLEMVGNALTENTLLRPLARPEALAVNCLFVPGKSMDKLV